MRRAWPYLLFVFIASQAIGQDNRRCVQVDHAKIIEDEKIINPSSMRIDGLSADEWYWIKKTSHSYQILFKKRQDKPVNLCYRVFPGQLNGLASIGSRDSSDTVEAGIDSKTVKTAGIVERQQLFDLGEINQGGQISRGISVGNTQDLFVNSTFNLDLEGKISDDLNIRASITDQNIPYEPEGNTQQLQDFDNVSVELFNDKFSVLGGDIALKDNGGYFMRYLRNVQGGMLGVTLDGSETQIGISAAKGRFGSVQLAVEDGVSGPYQIRPEGHTGYVIIIANSERVYIDGRLLKRGFNNDYIIDYNQAEISFTSNLMITQFSRVRIDFEYAVQNYARNIKTINHKQQVGNFTLNLGFYEEKDNRNRSLFQRLNDDQKELLSEVGDNLEMAISSGARQVPYSPDRILYALIDTLALNGDTTEVYVRVNEFQNPVYDVQFTEVGQGRGSYNIGEYLPQGRVYVWVGLNQGAYLPFVQLKAPDKKSMLTLNLEGKLNDYLQVYSEGAFSNVDQNLFSDLDNNDNQGFAIKSGLRIVNKPMWKNYKLTASLDGEFVNENFKALDRFRRVEFYRDWSDDNPEQPKRDLIGTLSIELKKDHENLVNYQTQIRDKRQSLSGMQHWIQLNKSVGDFQFNSRAFIMNSENIISNSKWQRLNAEVFRKGKIEPGLRYATDRNLVRAIGSDSLLSSANYFSSGEFFLRSQVNSQNTFEIAYVYREDKLPENGEIKAKTQSHFVSTRYNALLGETHNLNIRLNYRVFNELDSVMDVRNSISGSISWSGDVIPGIFRNTLNYSLSNARVARREYVFIPVPTGEGTHTWRDDNLDGEKDLDEFYEAINFDERNYIKLYVPTTQYTDAFENQLSYSANVKLPVEWRTAGGIKSIIAKFSNTTSVNSNYRTTGSKITDRLIPFLSASDPLDVLSMRSSVRSTMFFNRSNPRFGLTGGIFQANRKFLYTNGFESRKNQEYNLTIRWNIQRAYNFKVTSLSGNHVSSSDYLENRNFNIKQIRLSPSFSWQPKPTLRVTTTYQMGRKIGNTGELGAQTSNINEVIGEVKLGAANKFMVQGTLRYSSVLFNGNELSPMGYELLEGNRPGNNIRWQLNWQQTLLNGLQIGLFYEGRKPANSVVIHTGRAVVSAYF